MDFLPIRLSHNKTSSTHSNPSLGPKERGTRRRLQITHHSDSEFKVPAQGGDKEAAGTSVPKHRKAQVKQASSLPEPCRPDRSVTLLGSHWLCGLDSSTALPLLPLAQTSAPSLDPQLQLQASFRAVHSTQMVWQWQLPKMLWPSYCYPYTHNPEQIPTDDDAYTPVRPCPDYKASIFHATPLLKAMWASASMVMTGERFSIIMSQKP